MGISSTSGQLRLKVTDWWLAKIRYPCYKTLLSFIPACIVWEYWICRNRGRFEGDKIAVEYMMNNVISAIAGVYNQASIVNKVHS